MTTVNDLRTLMLYILDKNGQQGYFSPDEFDRTMNQGQASYVAYLLGSFQSYTPGRPVARVELGQNSVVRQRLQPTIYNYNLSIDSTGFSPYPSDYIQTDSMWSIYGFKRVRNIQQNYLASVYNSVIDPYATNPFYLIEDINFRFYPQSFGAARLSYVRNPPKIHWGYTVDVNGLEIYDPATSIQPIWDEVALWEIMARALLMCGVSLMSKDVQAYANQIIKTGQ